MAWSLGSLTFVVLVTGDLDYRCLGHWRAWHRVSWGSFTSGVLVTGELDFQCLGHWRAWLPVSWTLVSVTSGVLDTGELDFRCLGYWRACLTVSWSLGSLTFGVLVTGELDSQCLGHRGAWLPVSWSLGTFTSSFSVTGKLFLYGVNTFAFKLLHVFWVIFPQFTTNKMFLPILRLSIVKYFLMTWHSLMGISVVENKHNSKCLVIKHTGKWLPPVSLTSGGVEKKLSNQRNFHGGTVSPLLKFTICL